MSGERQEHCEAPSLLTGLRAATHDVHERLHVHPMTEPLTLAGLTQAHYIAVLKAFYGFYVPCEAQITDSVYASRAEWLAQDLDYFSVDRAAVEMDFNPPDISAPAALNGYHYVTEGSSLGAQVISKQLRKNLDVTPETGGRFFHAYGGETGASWKNFRATLESQSAARDDIIAGANATFLSLEKWLWHCYDGRQI